MDSDGLEQTEYRIKYCILHREMKPFVKPKTDSKTLTTKEELHKTKNKQKKQSK